MRREKHCMKIASRTILNGMLIDVFMFLKWYRGNDDKMIFVLFRIYSKVTQAQRMAQEHLLGTLILYDTTESRTCTSP